MSVISGVLEEELERLQTMEETYKKKISELPRGALIVKKRSGGNYYYLSYRNKYGISKQEYLKKSDDEIEEIRKQIEQRRRFEKTLREVKKDRDYVRKVLMNGRSKRRVLGDVNSIKRT